MTVRTATQTDTEIPEEERVPNGEQPCTFMPHDFDSSWATPPGGGEDTVPCLYCRACGEVRALRIPAEA